MGNANESLLSEPESSARWRTMITHAFNKAAQHSFYFVDSGLQRLKLFIGEEMQVPGQQNVVFKFACGPKQNVQELAQFGIRTTATTLRNVGWNRKGRPSHLARQAKGFVPWKDGRDVVHAHCKSMPFLPDFQLGVVLHAFTYKTLSPYLLITED
jgi:hypothetical protein